MYRWVSTAAGKKIRCKCDAVFRMPRSANEPATLERPAPPDHPASHIDAAHTPPPLKTGDAGKDLNFSEDDLNLYDLASDDFNTTKPATAAPEQTTCPSCHKAVKPGAVICINCGYNLKSGEQVRSEVVTDHDIIPPQKQTVPGQTFASARMGHRAKLGQTKEQADAQIRLQQIIDYQLPLCLTFIGVMLAITQGAFFGYSGEWSVIGNIVYVFAQLLFSVPFYLVALFVATKLMGVSFGNISAAAIKVCAIVMLPNTLGEIVSHVIPEVGWLVGWGLSWAIYFFLLSFLFELEMGETFMLIVVLFVVQLVAAFLFLMFAVTTIAALFA